jgi:hypothetical protein
MIYWIIQNVSPDVLQHLWTIGVEAVQVSATSSPAQTGKHRLSQESGRPGDDEPDARRVITRRCPSIDSHATYTRSYLGHTQPYAVCARLTSRHPQAGSNALVFFATLLSQLSSSNLLLPHSSRGGARPSS